jgi:hypothetical protein
MRVPPRVLLKPRASLLLRWASCVSQETIKTNMPVVSFEYTPELFNVTKVRGVVALDSLALAVACLAVAMSAAHCTQAAFG